MLSYDLDAPGIDLGEHEAKGLFILRHRQAGKPAEVWAPHIYGYAPG